MLKIFLGFILIVLAKSQHGAPGNRTCCSPGEPGMPGLKGDNGEIGAKGDKGAEGRTRYLGQPSSCSPMNCPVGPRGSQGYDGAWGEPGLPGPPGYEGIPGRRGEMGVEGPAGPAADSVLFLPYTTSSENTCYNFQRYCYVPGLSNGWRSWNRKGQTGYLVYKSWMFYVSLSRCPCRYQKPSLPQPVNCDNENCK